MLLYLVVSLDFIKTLFYLEVRNSRFFFLFLLFFGHEAGRISVPPPGIEHAPSAVEEWSLNCWTAREVLKFLFLFKSPGTKVIVLQADSLLLLLPWRD